MMEFSLDARVPVVFGGLADVTAHDAVLVEGTDSAVGTAFEPERGHAAGCVCCAPRGAAGRALSGLLQDRARGRRPFFTRVLAVTATPEGRAAVEAALSHDPVASACFRWAR